jgi:circadian clock protein KaiB
VRRPPNYKFRLYIAADTHNSVQARANLAELCRTYLPGRHEIEVVDVLQQPARALQDGIFMTPTLIMLAPAPVQRIVGTLSQTHTVLQALGIEAVA